MNSPKILKKSCTLSVKQKNYKKNLKFFKRVGMHKKKMTTNTDQLVHLQVYSKRFQHVTSLFVFLEQSFDGLLLFDLLMLVVVSVPGQDMSLRGLEHSTPSSHHLWMKFCGRHILTYEKNSKNQFSSSSKI